MELTREEFIQEMINYLKQNSQHAESDVDKEAKDTYKALTFDLPLVGKEQLRALNTSIALAVEGPVEEVPEWLRINEQFVNGLLYSAGRFKRNYSDNTETEVELAKLWGNVFLKLLRRCLDELAFCRHVFEEKEASLLVESMNTRLIRHFNYTFLEPLTDAHWEEESFHCVTLSLLESLVSSSKLESSYGESGTKLRQAWPSFYFVLRDRMVNSPSTISALLPRVIEFSKQVHEIPDGEKGFERSGSKMNTILLGTLSCIVLSTNLENPSHANERSILWKFIEASLDQFHSKLATDLEILCSGSQVFEGSEIEKVARAEILSILTILSFFINGDRKFGVSKSQSTLLVLNEGLVRDLVNAWTKRESKGCIASTGSFLLQCASQSYEVVQYVFQVPRISEKLKELKHSNPGEYFAWMAVFDVFDLNDSGIELVNTLFNHHELSHEWIRENYADLVQLLSYFKDGKYSQIFFAWKNLPSLILKLQRYHREVLQLRTIHLSDNDDFKLLQDRRERLVRELKDAIDYLSNKGCAKSD